MKNYTFLLHNTVGTAMDASAGLLYAHGMFFADDGFGNFISTDTILSVFSATTD